MRSARPRHSFFFFLCGGVLLRSPVPAPVDQVQLRPEDAEQQQQRRGGADGRLGGVSPGGDLLGAPVRGRLPPAGRRPFSHLLGPLRVPGRAFAQLFPRQPLEGQQLHVDLWGRVRYEDFLFLLPSPFLDLYEHLSRRIGEQLFSHLKFPWRCAF